MDNAVLTWWRGLKSLGFHPFASELDSRWVHWSNALSHCGLFDRPCASPRDAEIGDWKMPDFKAPVHTRRLRGG